jgi:hypothetical protein
MNCVQLFGDGTIYRSMKSCSSEQSPTDVITCPQLAALEQIMGKRIIYALRRPWLVVFADGAIASPVEIDYVGLVVGIHRMGRYFISRMKYPSGTCTTILVKVKGKWTFVDFGARYSSFSFNGRSLVGITKYGDEVHVTRDKLGNVNTRVTGKAKYGYSRFLVCATAAVLATSVPCNRSFERLHGNHSNERLHGTRITVTQSLRRTEEWTVTVDVPVQVTNQALVVDSSWLLLVNRDTKEPLLFYLRYKGNSVVRVEIDKQIYITDMWGYGVIARELASGQSLIDNSQSGGLSSEPPAHYTLQQGSFVKSEEST